MNIWWSILIHKKCLRIMFLNIFKCIRFTYEYVLITQLLQIRADILDTFLSSVSLLYVPHFTDCKETWEDMFCKYLLSVLVHLPYYYLQIDTITNVAPTTVPEPNTLPTWGYYPCNVRFWNRKLLTWELFSYNTEGNIRFTWTWITFRNATKSYSCKLCLKYKVNYYLPQFIF